MKHRSRPGTFSFSLILALVLGLSSSPAMAAPTCTPDLPEQCSPATTCGATMDDFNAPHFQIEFLSRNYDGGTNQTTFTYLVCRLINNPDLSHWVLGLCSNLRAQIVSHSGGTSGSGPVAPDPTTCLDGMKWESNGVPLCNDTCPAGSNTGGVFSVTLAGNVPTAIVPAGVTVATKAGRVLDDICLEGPSCDPVTTTTSSSSTSSTSSTSSSTSTTTEDTLETTTTTTSTSTTTLPLPDCGDGNIDPGEECDPPGSFTCPGGTPGGAFLQCDFACQCPEPTTTTTSTSSTTSSSTSTTVQVTTTTTSSTSTTFQCVDNENCADGDICTEDICENNVCTNPTIPPSGNETICNDMQDNDCDGLVDCDDPDCAGIDLCPPIKKDPSKIIFGKGPNGSDVFKSHGRVEPSEPIDVSDVEVGWMISGPNGHIYRAALIAGDFRSNNKKTTFRFVDRRARESRSRRFGVFKAKVRISRGGTSYGYKVLAYGDMSKATSADMAIQFYIGDRIFIHDQPWQQTSYGWKATAFE